MFKALKPSRPQRSDHVAVTNLWSNDDDVLAAILYYVQCLQLKVSYAIIPHDNVIQPNYHGRYSIVFSGRDAKLAYFAAAGYLAGRIHDAYVQEIHQRLGRIPEGVAE